MTGWALYWDGELYVQVDEEIWVGGPNLFWGGAPCAGPWGEACDHDDCPHEPQEFEVYPDWGWERVA